MSRILIVDDNEDICFILSRYLEKNGFKTDQAFNGKRALTLLEEHQYQVVLCDYRLPDTDGLEMLQRIKKIQPNATVIVMTAYSDVKIAVNTIKAGAYDYVTKPLHQEEILHTIQQALKAPASKDKTKSAPAESSDTEKYVVGKSAQAREINKQVELVAPTDLTVIIYGESGTGKEAVANMIHLRSNRAKNPFVTLDCGALPKDLAKSELFGHVKGAFTGAITDKVGHFELANGGTLFLDEIANLTYEVQIALLRVLQERVLKRIGGTKEVNLDLRIIVASNEDLYEAVREGKFREDLFHRFNEFKITIPPLRDRKEDIKIYAEYFLKVANKDLHKDVKGFSSEVEEAFFNYRWDGNLRELKNIIKRAVLLTNNDEIQITALPPEITDYRPSLDDLRPQGVNYSFGGAGRAEGGHDRDPADLKSIAKEAEYDTIIKVLRQVNFNKTKAAKILNIDRKTLYNKLKAYNITD